MPTVAEPRDPELFAARASQYRGWFLAGRIGEETYRASLRILGLRDQDLSAEVNLAKMEKSRNAG